MESNQAEADAPVLEEATGEMDAETSPSLDEQDTISDEVNQAPPLVSQEGHTVGVGPAPGTESTLAPGKEHPGAP